MQHKKQRIDKSAPTAEMLRAEIRRLARAGNFPAAEKLRRYLIDVFPLALHEIIDAAEVIREQKIAQIDHQHLAVWHQLYSQLTREEGDTLVYHTRAATVPLQKLLLRQGKRSNRLFFIDSGQVAIYHVKDGERVVLGKLVRGDLLGADSFYDICMSAVSASCQSKVSLRYLDKELTEPWKRDFPGLCQKLKEYCLHNEKTHQMLLAKNFEKRKYPRLTIDGRVTAHILKTNGQRSGKSVRGSLQDLSRNGLSFDIQCSKADIAKALLGRSLDMTLELYRKEQTRPVQGRIVKIGANLQNDYSVHVGLHTELLTDEFNNFSGIRQGVA